MATTLHPRRTSSRAACRPTLPIPCTAAVARGTLQHFRDDARFHATQAFAETSLERIVLAINDRPIALYALAHYDSLRAETLAAVGMRIVLFDRADPRVAKL